jgi:hypothetical protein
MAETGARMARLRDTKLSCKGCKEIHCSTLPTGATFVAIFFIALVKK